MNNQLFPGSSPAHADNESDADNRSLTDSAVVPSQQTTRARAASGSLIGQHSRILASKMQLDLTPRFVITSETSDNANNIPANALSSISSSSYNFNSTRISSSLGNGNNPTFSSLSNTTSNTKKGNNRSRSSSLIGFKQKLQNLTSGGLNSNSKSSMATYANINELSHGHSPRNSIDDYVSMRRDSINSSNNYDMSNINLNLKNYNKLLINYLSAQGLNINPLRLKQYKYSKNSGGLLSLNLGGSSNYTMKPTKNKTIQTFITGNGQLLFLPYNPAKKREQLVSGILEDDEGDDDDSDEEDGIEESEENDTDSTIINNVASMTNSDNNNSGSTKREGHHPHNVSNHTFGVILKISKAQSLNSIIKANYRIDAVTKWPQGLAITTEEGKIKNVFKENYKVANDINWDLDLSKPDCFIPFKDINGSAVHHNSNNDDGNLINSNNFNSSLNDDLNFELDAESIATGESSKASSTDTSNTTNSASSIICSPEPSQQVRRLQLLHPKDYIDEKSDTGTISSFSNENLGNATSHHRRKSSFSLNGNNNTNSKSEGSLLFKASDNQANKIKNFSPGYYIFLLPVVYPLSTPESVYTNSASLVHKLSIQLQKSVIPNIPPPPSAFLSTSPIHKNKLDHSQNVPTSNSHSNNFDFNSSHKEKKGSFFKHFIGSGKSNSSNTGDNENDTTISPISSFTSNLLSPIISPSLSSPINILSSSKSDNNNDNPNENELYEFDYQLPVIRLPPSDATSTLNKSIYINKVWNDALNYEILLPKKFVQLSSVTHAHDQMMKNNQITIQLKIIPLIKSLCLKRIKINVTEKITYISKDKKYEKDSGMVDASGVKERVVTLMEIKTKDKGNNSQALNTQIIPGCVNNNLLTRCYNNGNLNNNGNESNNNNSNGNTEISIGSLLKNRSRSNSGNLINRKRSKSQSPFVEINEQQSTPEDEVVITNPIKVQCPLIFQANNENGFIHETYENLVKGQGDINDGLVEENLDNFKDEAVSLFSSMSNNTVIDESNVNNLNETLNDISSLSKSKSPSTKKVSSLSAISAAANSIPVGHSNSDNNINYNNGGTNNNKVNSNAIKDVGFYPDATFHNVKIRHRIQFCFRISKPDEKDVKEDGSPKLHHYEVIVDTPIIFISPFCVSENLELPSYDYVVKSSNLNVSNTVGPGGEFIFKNRLDEYEDEYDENDEYNEDYQTLLNSLRPENNRIKDKDLPTFEQAMNMKATLLPSSPMMNATSDLSMFMINNASRNRASSITPRSGSITANGTGTGESTNSSNTLNEDIQSTTLLSTSPLSIDSGFQLNGYRNDPGMFNNLDQLISPDDSNNRGVDNDIVPEMSNLNMNNESGMEFTKRPILKHIPTDSSIKFNSGNSMGGIGSVELSGQAGLPSYETVMDEIVTHQDENLLKGPSPNVESQSESHNDEHGMETVGHSLHHDLESLHTNYDDDYSINDTLNEFNEVLPNRILR